MNRTRHFILVAFFACLVQNVSSICRVQTSGKLQVVRKLFSKSVLAKPTELVLNNDETAEVYCFGLDAQTQSSQLICLDNQLFRVDANNELQRAYDLTCPDTFGYKLYENRITMPRCEQYWSFALGIKLDDSISKAAICYDVPNGSLKSLNYASSYSNDMDVFEKVPSLSTAFLLKEIDELDQFLAKEGLHEEKLLVLGESFRFETLILDDLSSKLGSHSKAFEIPFWTKLYNGNWKRFLEAFQEHTESTDLKYNIFSGVSANLAAPQLYCQKQKIYKDIPRYIWTYIKPFTNDSKSEEIVVIADNSPYTQIGDLGLLCKNRCNKIDWLHDHRFGRFNLMPSYGLMYCCKPHEVHLKLDFFPTLEYNEDNIPKEDLIN